MTTPKESEAKTGECKHGRAYLVTSKGAFCDSCGERYPHAPSSPPLTSEGSNREIFEGGRLPNTTNKAISVSSEADNFPSHPLNLAQKIVREAQHGPEGVEMIAAALTERDAYWKAKLDAKDAEWDAHFKRSIDAVLDQRDELLEETLQKDAEIERLKIEYKALKELAVEHFKELGDANEKAAQLSTRLSLVEAEKKELVEAMGNIRKKCFDDSQWGRYIDRIFRRLHLTPKGGTEA
jgi:hypothetical protein